jgi:hypothetical protein
MLGCHLEAGIILMKNLTYIQSAKHFFNVAYLGIFLILRKLNDLGKNL